MAFLDPVESAERLALIIKRFWARQDKTVNVEVTPERIDSDGLNRRFIHVVTKSDMLNGMPRLYCAVFA